ncbi:MAG TPA: hypothetical protein VFC16_00685, partial [Nakamurella sp.]|nr:hypothetical protein [Nakamurella sp.]
AVLDAAWRATAATLSDTAPAGDTTTDGRVSVDADGRLHVGKDDALDEPASLRELRARVAGMLPRVDLPELILEVMTWHPEFARAFTSVTGAVTRLSDVHISVAALPGRVAQGARSGSGSTASRAAGRPMARPGPPRPPASRRRPPRRRGSPVGSPARRGSAPGQESWALTPVLLITQPGMGYRLEL